MTLGILILILGFSLNVGFNAYHRADYYAERDFVVRLLQSARGSALANINGERHGIKIDVSEHEYLILEGDEVILRMPIRTGVSVEEVDGGDSTIMFRQNSGRSTGGRISISDDVRSGIIVVNQVGAILWE